MVSFHWQPFLNGEMEGEVLESGGIFAFFVFVFVFFSFIILPFLKFLVFFVFWMESK